MLPSHADLQFVAAAVRREFAQRHRGAILGRAWVVLQPAAMIAIYTVVFSQVMHGRLPGAQGVAASPWGYSVFLCAGLLPWNLFAETLTRVQNGFFDQALYLKKTTMPMLTPALVGLGIAVANFALAMLLFAAFLLVVGLWPGWALLWLIPALGVQMALAAGAGLALGTVTVFFRDVQTLVQLVLQFGFWFTPIVYPLVILPAWAQAWVMQVNPLAPLMLWYQTVLLEGRMPDWGLLAPAATWAVLALLGAGYLLRRRGGELVDLL
ncbi:MAG: ABC transporter permease [Burkholderiales bacterium]|nr:ABC transporter permease [Burkholderiales bacterium]